MSYASTIKNLVPPIVWNFGKRKLPALVRALGGHYTHIQFRGDYASFAQARAASTGYDAPAILAKTREALLKVKRGEKRWEQDAMVSDTDEQPWSLLACLAFAAARPGGKLHVLDFGGSLGTTYFRCRNFLGPEIDLRWTVVEQPEHVRVGQADFQTDRLRFAFRIQDVLGEATPDVFLCSGVLQFLEDPEQFLSEVTALKIPFLILDRTPLWDLQHHRLTVQTVPREIYEASYPAWFLSRDRIVRKIETEYLLRCRASDSECWEIDAHVVQNALYFFEYRRAE